jgi:hypothetical protein
MGVWGVTLAAFCLGLPMLGSVTAFDAVLSLTVIPNVIVTVTPITARCTWGRYFKPGPFDLGVWAYPLAVISTLWMVFAPVVFCLPIELPASAGNLNYASIGFIGTCIISLAMFFFLRCGAYKWFTGPACAADVDSTQTLDVAVACKDGDKDSQNMGSVSTSGSGQGCLLLLCDASLFIEDVVVGCK